MHRHDPDELSHCHRFISESAAHNERRTLLVVGLTAVTMVAEIVVGTITGSMALLADGWHMGSHVAALGLTAFAYSFARRHAHDRRFSFGTGKVGSLAGYSSALFLGLIALLMIWESSQRLIAPVEIQYGTAIAVAVVGLLVNLVSAWLLGGQHHHGHGSEHGHHHHHHHDHNLRAAYVHVLADALTSILAIAALTGGAFLGLVWLDPAMGIVGAAIILWWSYGLVMQSSHVLLDFDSSGAAAEEVKKRIEADADNRVVDLHLWQVGTEHLALILSVSTHRPRHPDHYKGLLAGMERLSHVTVEVLPCRDEHASLASSA